MSAAPRRLLPGSLELKRGRGVTSTDPRKPVVVSAFKLASNCRKVTCVAEVGPNTYQANCMNPNEGGVPGFWEVEIMVRAAAGVRS